MMSRKKHKNCQEIEELYYPQTLTVSNKLPLSSMYSTISIGTWKNLVMCKPFKLALQKRFQRNQQETNAEVWKML